MALKSEIYKVDLQIANMDRHYYAQHKLTLAKHPSETLTRLLLRLLVFALNAQTELLFGKGISTRDEPDLWKKKLTDEIELWIDLGQPDEKRIRKACHQAKQVIVYNYTQASAETWWQTNHKHLQSFDNLSIFLFPDEFCATLNNFDLSTKRIQFNQQDNIISLSNEHTVATTELLAIMPSP
ncbi:MAG: YaeQ family protein [Gammaproteobacteria bacterium]|nr:YaeQ family protein [Gammaproteobacteria bacterium]MDH5730165.1 YaeQ family protein [Gammaproteobacteria bacterium]